MNLGLPNICSHFVLSGRRRDSDDGDCYPQGRNYKYNYNFDILHIFIFSYISYIYISNKYNNKSKYFYLQNAKCFKFDFLPANKIIIRFPTRIKYSQAPKYPKMIQTHDFPKKVLRHFQIVSTFSEISNVPPKHIFQNRDFSSICDFCLFLWPALAGLKF